MRSRETLIRLQRFQVDEKRRAVSEIEAMIADFERKIAELDQQISIEQERSGITDVKHFAYPMFAKAAGDRKEKLLQSVSGLKEQHGKAQDALAEEFGELMTSGSMAIARAMHSRCCWPPDRAVPEVWSRSLTSAHRPARCRLRVTIASRSAAECARP